MNTTPTAPAAIALTISTNEARADSRQLADYLGLKHKSVIQTINDHQANFERLGKVRFQNAPSTGSLTGQRVRWALLNEDQAYFLLSLSRNTSRVVDLKLELVIAFRNTRLNLAAYQQGTLPSFKGLQDAIQAVPGGPGPWLFSNINKLVNATAGIAAGSRTQCAAIHQAMLTLLQSVATRAVLEAVDTKDAYNRVKLAVSQFAVPTLQVIAA